MNGASEDTLRELLLVAQSTNANMAVLQRLMKNMVEGGGSGDVKSSAEGTKQLGIAAMGANLAIGGLRMAAAAAGVALGTMTAVLGRTIGVLATSGKNLYSFSEAAADGQATIAGFLKSFSNLPFFIGTLFSFAGEIYKIQEGMLSSYLDMTKVGASFSGSLVQMNQTAMRAGLTLGELTRFTRNYSEILATAIGGVDGGLRKFSEVQSLLTGPNSEYAKNLFGLGYTAEEVADALGIQMAVQGDMSKIQLKDSKKIAESVNAFATQLDLATKLSGKNREEEQQKAKALAMESSFQYFLQKYPDDVKNQLLLAVNVAGQLGGKGLADIIKQSIMTGGTWVPLTDEMKSVVTSLGGDMQSLVTDFMKLGNSTTMDANQKADLIVNLQRRIGTAYKQNVLDPMGNMAPLLNMMNHSLFTNNELYKSAILSGKSEKEARDMARNATQQQTKQAIEQAQALQRNQRALTLFAQGLRDKLVSVFGPFAGSMLKFALRMIDFVMPHLESLGKWFQKTWISLENAYKKEGLTGLFKALFKTTGDILSNVWKLMKDGFTELKPALLKIWDELLPVVEAIFYSLGGKIWQIIKDYMNPFSATKKLEAIEEIKRKQAEGKSLGRDEVEDLKKEPELRRELEEREKRFERELQADIKRRILIQQNMRARQAPQRVSTGVPVLETSVAAAEPGPTATATAPPPTTVAQAETGTIDNWNQLTTAIQTLVAVNRRVEEHTKQTVQVVRNINRDYFQYG